MNYYVAYFYRLANERSCLMEKKTRKIEVIVEQVFEWLMDPDCMTVRISYPPTQECQKSEYWANGVMSIFEQKGWIRIHHLCHSSTPFDDRLAGQNYQDYAEQLLERDRYTFQIYERVKALLQTERIHICTQFEMHDELECGLSRNRGVPRRDADGTVGWVA